MPQREILVINAAHDGTARRIIDTEIDIPKSVVKTWASKFRSVNKLKITENSFFLKDMVGLSKWYNTEFAACIIDKSLYIIKGGEPDIKRGVLGQVKIPSGAKVLLHTHPAEESKRVDYEIDLKNSSYREATVDYNFNIVVYESDQIFNKKNERTGNYEGLTYRDTYWPDFLTKTTNYNVEVVVKK